jgi:hypothetical protein
MPNGTGIADRRLPSGQWIQSAREEVTHHRLAAVVQTEKLTRKRAAAAHLFYQ